MPADEDAAPSPFSHSIAGNHASTKFSRRVSEVDARPLTLRAVQSVVRDPAPPHSHVAALTVNASASRFDRPIDSVSLNRAARDLNLAINQMEPTPTRASDRRLRVISGDH